MLCERCGTHYDASDNFCRHCGSPVPLDSSALPAVVDVQSSSTNLPTPWQATAPIVARGVAVLVAGTLLEMAARWFTRRALGAINNVDKQQPANGRERKAIRLTPITKGEPPTADDAAVYSESYTYQRIIIRR